MPAWCIAAAAAAADVSGQLDDVWYVMTNAVHLYKHMKWQSGLM